MMSQIKRKIKGACKEEGVITIQEGKRKKVFLCIGILIMVLLTINFSVYKITGKNYIEIGTRKLLASLGIYTEEIKNVEIKSSGWENKDGGSWHIDKSAKWTSTSSAQVQFNVNTIMKTGERNKDVIFVLDISGSMSGDKLEKVKSDSTELVEYILSNEQNRVAVITFDSTSEILTSFTNDKENTISKIESLTTKGCTNYNAGLLNVQSVLDGYVQESNRDLVVLFLTDGYPNEDTPNQVAMYETLKDKYPFITINGVQYEMGQSIIQEIKDISDDQFLANMETLNNILFEASIAPEPYETFEVIDYIHDDYFYLESENDIEVSIGTIKLEEENGVQKITWTFGENNFKTGGSATMTINLKLKEQYVGTKGYYPTNKKEEITSKLPEEEEENVSSTKTPVLKNNYEVIYDTNPPTGCDIKSETKETHFIYETVMKKTEAPICDGYIFKGWEIVDEDVDKINDDYFIMPEHDVTIRATWATQSISKSMDGTVNEKLTLYKVIKNEALANTGFAAEYTGNGASTFTNPVYYYKGAVTTNNVLFANFCWKMVRTTDTGGVKLVYNGIPDENGTCNNTGAASQLSSTSAFNSSYSSPAYVGYMYNKVYSYSNKSMTSTSSNSTSNTPIYRLSMTNSTNYYFAKSYTVSGNTYTLTDPEQLGTWTNIYSTMAGAGYYTCKLTTTGTCTTLYYVLGGASSYAYTLALTSGKELDAVNTNITMGTDMTDNGDGTYSLAGTITTIKKADWYTNYTSYKNVYFCSDYTSTTCNSMYYTTATTIYTYTYANVANNYKYANDVVYENGSYKLIDTDVSGIKQFWNYTANYTTLGKNHYTCFNTSGECTSVYYIHYVGSTPYYMTLTGGTKIEEALEQMLWADNVNTTDSKIKNAIDTWYAANMTDYTKYLEDTVFCNDRSLSSLGGWDPNGGATTTILQFRVYSGSYDLTCKNKTDQFTVSAENGNGALTYPVGLLTRDEAGLAGSTAMKTGNYYWLGSPDYFGSSYAFGYLVYTSGYLFNYYVGVSLGVRPSVSLLPGTEYVEGDGTVEKPYIVSLDE